jgi:Ala-tRNA(Pro) deacylase
MPTQKLKLFLDEHNIHFVSIIHSRAYTTQMVARSAHIHAKELAKTVIVEIDGDLAMAVLPASDNVDLDMLKQSTGAQELRIASEEDFKYMFPDCEIGAMPPFGNLYDMAVFVSPRLAEDEQIAFNAGTHTELVQLAYTDFVELVSPAVVRLSDHD